jgi:predicted aldo/keto reductase-like oxidoreductase
LINEPQDVERIFEEQLRKCQVDYFDFYLLHNLSEERLATEKRHRIYDQLNEKKRKGQIKYLGFSFHESPEVLERIINSYEWDFVQIQLNYMDWEMQQAQKQYELITNKNIPVVVMEPVRGGALAKLSPEAIKVFKDAAPDAGLASWAMRYAASLPNVLTVLSGMSDLQQVKDNVKTLTHFKALTADDYKTVGKALQAYLLSGAIPCTACRYCMDCPNGVYIPQVFDQYNRYCADGNPDYFVLGYQMIGKEHQAHNCTECEQCADLCPQSLPISEWMVKITEFAESLAEAQ